MRIIRLMTRKILFLHGFFASGNCAPARALQQYFDGKATILAPDLPAHPKQAIELIDRICRTEQPDLLVGNSNGSFLGQIVVSGNGLPALLGNPHLEMTSFLSERIGSHEYKTPRADGRQQLTIDQALIDEFAEVQLHQWDHCRPEYRDRVWGLFGEHDTVAHYEPLFRQHYTQIYHFPGGHTPTDEEVRTYYAPLAERLLTL